MPEAVPEAVPEHEVLDGAPLRISTSPQLSGVLDGVYGGTPHPSPTVDSVLHSIWVDIIDVDELKFGRRLGRKRMPTCKTGSRWQCAKQPNETHRRAAAVSADAGPLHGI